MQLTNFLRDIAEDYVELDRIYMPQKELEQFGLSHDNIIQFCNGEPINNDFIAFMQYYIQRCDDMYQESFD
ncbi:squalene/phytoene synthase family protein [bacterium]|nr:squalene/phytoene synthase family protein [bacterium]